MATSQARPYDNEIKLGAPQVFALKFTTGKAVASRFPGGRAMFTAIDERKIFLNDEETSEFEHALLDQRIQPGEFISVSRITHGRGGGHAIRVERVEEREAPGTLAVRRPQSREEVRGEVPTREEALLEKSVELARERGAAAFHRAPARISPEPPPAPATEANNGDHSVRAHQLKGSFLAAIDAIAEAQKYADAQGLKVTFTSDDVRAAAISVFIQAEKAAMGARY